MSTWRPKDFVIAVAFIAAGFVLEALLPSWLWSLFGLVGFVAYLAWAARRNRRDSHSRMRPGWVPGREPPT